MADENRPPRRPGRKVRVELRRNRAQPARGKGRYARRILGDEIEQEDAAQLQNIGGRSELSRKRTVVIRDEPETAGGLREGRVVALRGLYVDVEEGERRWSCTIRRMLRTRLIAERAPLAVGDIVRFRAVARVDEPDAGATAASKDPPEGVVEEVQPRRSVLTREYERRVQVVAANVDLAVIVVAADQPPLRPHLIDRYLVAIHRGGIEPLICINKMDLDASGFAASVGAAYENIGYRVLLTCACRESGAATPSGLEALGELLRDRTSVLFGPSGVGKSSLINALDPDLCLKVGTLSDLQRGRHTTTTARLLRWRFGGYVVDTPGLRQFEPAGVAPGELEACFLEFVDLIHHCRFPNCSHTHEQDCAVKAAVETGSISIDRYESYCKMYAEAAAKPKY